MAGNSGKWLRATARTPGLAERLKRARKSADLTQERVAEALRVSTKSVYLWESGQTAPTVSHLNSLAALYQKPVEWLVRGSGDELTDRLNQIRDRIGRIPPDMLDAVDRFLDALETSPRS